MIRVPLAIVAQMIPYNPNHVKNCCVATYLAMRWHMSDTSEVSQAALLSASWIMILSQVLRLQELATNTVTNHGYEGCDLPLMNASHPPAPYPFGLGSIDAA